MVTGWSYERSRQQRSTAEAYNGCLPLLSEYSTRLGQNRQLFEAYQSLADSEEFTRLDSAQQKVINDNLRDFRLAGVALEDEQKARYGEIKKQLADLTSQFSDNVLDATMAWSKLITDESELAGLPESALAGAKQLAESKQKAGWLLNLDFPSYFPVMTYCDNRESGKRFTLRSLLALLTRDRMPGSLITLKTSEILSCDMSWLNWVLKLREYSLATKMAESPDKVIEFLKIWLQKASPGGAGAGGTESVCQSRVRR